MALNRENYLLHKLHSLSGVIPIGFYMLQHLTLNTFSLGGPEKFNAVIGFFAGMPKHFLLGLEVVAIWIPLLFHSIYGLFISSRAKNNYFTEKYGFSENRMYTFQRWSGIFLFVFLTYHVLTTTVAAKLRGEDMILFAAWHEKLTSFGYIFLVFYMLGIVASSYHLSYGIWNFCIRWGITISEAAQVRIQKVSAALFVGITLLGWAALFGFVIPHDGAPNQASETSTAVDVSFRPA